MLSHQLGAGQQLDLGRHTRLVDELHRLRQSHDSLTKRSQQHIQARDHKLESLERAFAKAEAERHRLTESERACRRELEDLKRSSRTTIVSDLERRLQKLERQHKDLTSERDQWRRAYESEQLRNSTLQSEHEQLQEASAALEQIIASELDGSASGSEDKHVEMNAQTTDLRGTHLLYVGGRHHLVDHYRTLVERCNGRFTHHDGGKEDNPHRLESMLASVDTVVCATDCVSHDACLRLKRYCKRHSKEYLLLHSSGLSSLARAIGNLASSTSRASNSW